MNGPLLLRSLSVRVGQTKQMPGEIQGWRSLHHFSFRSGGGQSEEKGGAVAKIAFGADGAAVGQHDVLGDGEAEAGAAGFAGAGFVDAIETFEEARQVLGGDTGAKILNIEFDSEFDATLGGARSEQDASAGAAVLHRIVD